MEQSRKKKKNNILIILTVIFLICATAVGIFLYKRYSYTKEKMNLDVYFDGISGRDMVVYYNDKRLPTKDILSEDENTIIEKKVTGLNIDECVFLPYIYVKEKLNPIFYFDENNRELLYSNPTYTDKWGFSSIYRNQPMVYVHNEQLYINMLIIKERTNIDYEMDINTNNKVLFIYDKFGQETYTTLKKDEQVRFRGGNKSPILTTVKENEEVKVLNQMYKWCCVKTKDGIIGYVRNIRLNDNYEVNRESNFVKDTYSHISSNKKILTAFHQMFSSSDDKKLEKALENITDINALSPTWFRIENNEGKVNSIANKSYVEYAHKKGIEVHPTINNFDYPNVKSKILFSNSNTRKKIIDQLLEWVREYNLDGINIDIEDIAREAKDDYVQFMRECSIAFRNEKKILSVCQSPPYEKNDRYEFEKIGELVDYMVVMAYDEHTKGSEPGPVASINFVEESMKLCTEKMDKERIICALPFYVRVWETDKNGEVTLKAYGAKTFEEKKEELELTDFHWDFDAGCNYAFVEKNGIKREVWLEDLDSIKYKMLKVKNFDPAGVAFWKLGMEMDGFIETLVLK